MALNYTGPYTTFYYNSVNACRSTLTVGAPANAYFICILDNMQKNQYTYSYGFKNGKLPYEAAHMYLSLYKPMLNLGESYAVGVFYQILMPFAAAISGTLTQKQVNKMLYGK